MRACGHRLFPPAGASARPLLLCRREQMESSQAAWLAQAEKYEDTHLGGYRRIFPAEGTEKYTPFFKHSGSLFQETVASKAREECARYQGCRVGVGRGR